MTIGRKGKNLQGWNYIDLLENLYAFQVRRGQIAVVKHILINVFDHYCRLAVLEEKLRDPGSVANIDCLLDTVTALVADCDHDNVKRIKTIEAYTSRCMY